MHLVMQQNSARSKAEDQFHQKVMNAVGRFNFDGTDLTPPTQAQARCLLMTHFCTFTHFFGSPTYTDLLRLTYLITY